MVLGLIGSRRHKASRYQGFRGGSGFEFDRVEEAQGVQVEGV